MQRIDVEGKPEKPILSGPASGKPTEEYTYSAVGNDPNNDDIYYNFNWDDGTKSDCIGTFESGEEYSASHIWNKQGKYEVRVRVKDENGFISEWSDPLSVSMPRSKSIDKTIFYWIIEQHPTLYRLIQIIFNI